MKHNRRHFLLQGSALSLGTLLPPSWLLAEETDPEKSASKMMTPATDRAIERGLQYLASEQLEDGAFGDGGYSRNVAICALAGLAFMSGGSSPGRGPYGEQVDRCVKFLLKNTGEGGFISESGTSSHGPMYGHGFATLMLAQAYGMTPRKDIRRKLSDATRLIVRTQNKEGGWRYQPRANAADVSVTVCQMMALRAARNTGLHVPKETRDRCVKYIKQNQNPDGGFSYMLQGDSAFPRSAAGIVSLYSAGVYDGPEIEKGLKYLMKFVPGPEQLRQGTHYFYGQYYAVQAMWHAGGSYWKKWYPAIREQLLPLQRESDGAWADLIGQQYGTSMACIILQMPNNSLPIFQR